MASGHQEQMSMILKYVDYSSHRIKIEESFLGFLHVKDTSGQSLFEVLQNELFYLDFNIHNVQG